MKNKYIIGKSYPWKNISDNFEENEDYIVDTLGQSENSIIGEEIINIRHTTKVGNIVFMLYHATAVDYYYKCIFNDLQEIFTERELLLSIVNIERNQGGSFEKAFGVALKKASPDNRMKLAITFPDLIHKY